MTTGMKQDQTTTPRERKRNWLLPALGIVLAIALLAWAFQPKQPADNTPNQTGESVQNSATGQQGSVGRFSDTVTPNQDGQTKTDTNNPDFQSVPPGAQPGDNRGVDAGAGNSGITTTTDNLGGGSTPQPKSGR